MSIFNIFSFFKKKPAEPDNSDVELRKLCLKIAVQEEHCLYNARQVANVLFDYIKYGKMTGIEDEEA